MRPLSVFALLVCLLSPLWTAAQGQNQGPDPAARLAQMSLAEKAGQVFMVSIYGRNLPEAGAALITDYHPGAVALFAYNTDYQPLAEVASLINQMQALSTADNGPPLFIALDHEGGRVRRLVNGVTRFPDPLGFGALPEPGPYQTIGRLTGAELRAVGVNMNLAPVLDLFSRPDLQDKNRVLYRRTLGDDPARVGPLGAAYAAGLAESGVVGVGKHYPGHGEASDSHLGLAILETSPEAFAAGPLVAFQTAIQGGLPAIMVGHLYYRQVEPGPNLPASLSPHMIGLLRQELGFEGLVMTDALDMAAISANYPIPEAALMALNAGVDMVVLGPQVSWPTQRAAIERIIAAVESGELSEARLDEAVLRILRLKADYGLLDWAPVEAAGLEAAIDLPAAQAALSAAYGAAATLIQDQNDLLPLPNSDQVAVIFPAIYPEIYEACLALGPQAKYYGYTFFPSTFDFNAVSRLGIEAERAVIFIEDAYKNRAQADLVRVLPPEKTVVVALASPYDLEAFPTAGAWVALYSSELSSRPAACPGLFGERPFTGAIPLAVGDYPSGTGQAD